MPSTALTVNPLTPSPDLAVIGPAQSKPAHKPGFFPLPAIMVRFGQERVKSNCAGHDLTGTRQKANAKLLASQTAVGQRATRNRADSEDPGYCSDDTSPPLSATSSGSGSSGSSIWYVPAVPTRAAKDDIPCIDADDAQSPAASLPSVEQESPLRLPQQRLPQQRPPRQHLIPSKWLLSQGKADWLLGPAPAPPAPEPGKADAQSAPLSATLPASVSGPPATAPVQASGPVSDPENANFVFDVPPRVAASSQPWYSGIGNFIAAQLNRLRDGLNAVRDMIFPTAAQTNTPAAANDTYAANRSVPRSPEEIAALTLAIGLEIAEDGRDDVRKAADMDAFRRIKFRGLTSMYDLLDPQNNTFKAGPAASNTPPTPQEQSKPAAQEAFRHVLTQAEQQAYWDAQKVLKPLGHTLGNGSRAINALEDPTDFAAFRKQVLDAFDIAIVAMEKVKAALSPKTATGAA